MMPIGEDNTSDQTNGTNYSPASEQEAWMAIIYACANADEYISNTEIDKFTRALSYKELFEAVDMVAIYEKVNEAASTMENHQLINACASKVSKDMRATLFSLAVELVVSDGLLHGEEEKTIQHLRAALELDKDLAQKIIDVLYIRFKGNVVVKDDEDDHDDLHE